MANFFNLIGRIFMRYMFGPVMYSFFRYVMGWKIEGQLPEVPKMVVVLAPHTSNMDFSFMVVLSVHFKRWSKWMGKRELFSNPIQGFLLTATGGLPVNRDAPLKATKEAIAYIEQADEIILAITPDGTRQYTDHWKKGFYFIAHKMKLPIVFMALDYGTKTVRVREAFYTTGDADKDLDSVRPFYDGVTGRIPENASRIQFE